MVRRLLMSPGWIQRTADHCMHRRAVEPVFPRKRSCWLLYNIRTDVPLKKCDNTCGCVLPGTNYHKLLICNRVDKKPGQQVITDTRIKARIPWGMFDVLYSNRAVSVRTVENPNKPIQQLTQMRAPVDEIMKDTGTALDADVRARVAMINGKTFLQCA